jgi:hypothetical protein
MSRAAWLMAAFSLCIALDPAGTRAHQPVMDMAPRWKRGWGVEVRHEARRSDRVKDGDSSAANPLGREQRVNTTWVEGVYAFVPEFRLTAKIPWVDQRRTIARNGTAVKQSGTGLGDVILGAPIKKLLVGPGTLADLAFTPSIRLPTGDTDDGFPAGDGSVDGGVSLTYKRDISWFYQYYDVYYWANGRGKKHINADRDGDEVGFDINLGVLPYHNMESNTGIWLMWDVQARYQDRGSDADGATGGVRMSMGPMIMWYRDNLMLHAQYTVPAYEKYNGSQVAYGHELTLGAGITF